MGGVDVRDLHGFYESPLGAVTRRLVGRTLATLWPDLRGLSLLGLGFPTPYVAPFVAQSERTVVFMPAWQGAIAWSTAYGCATALADPLVLPLAEASVDRVLVVHALELADSPDELLYEVARILTPSGRAIIVCPNRRGLWARMDTTPFGHGQPFSRRQLRHVMRQASLQPERWAETLYAPPIASPLLLRGAGVVERCGAGLGLPFAGVHVVEAVKLLHRPIPVSQTRRRARPRPVFLPVPASRSRV